MKNALKKIGMHKFSCTRIETMDGDIIKIDRNGILSRSEFKIQICFMVQRRDTSISVMAPHKFNIFKPFCIQPGVAYINDINSELTNVYNVIKYYPEALIAELNGYENTAEFYSRIRELDRDFERFATLSAVQQATRFIYLNKTCFKKTIYISVNAVIN